MRSITSTILLLVLLFQITGTLVLFKVQQRLIRKEVKQQIKAGVPEAELILLKIPKTLEAASDKIFQRIHDREFRYRGKMYDIVRSEEHGQVTWYYCLSDEKETHLFAQLDTLVEREMNHKPERQKQTQTLERLLNSLYLVHTHGGIIYRDLNDSHAPTYQFTLSTWTPTPSFPPPQV